MVSRLAPFFFVGTSDRAALRRKDALIDKKWREQATSDMLKPDAETEDSFPRIEPIDDIFDVLANQYALI